MSPPPLQQEAQTQPTSSDFFQGIVFKAKPFGAFVMQQEIRKEAPSWLRELGPDTTGLNPIFPGWGNGSPLGVEVGQGESITGNTQPRACTQ